MSVNSNLRVDVNPEDRLVRQVVAICAKHGVAYGSPEDLPGFVHALSENKHLAMDFWSMVARIPDSGSPAVTNADWQLRIIAEGVTGRTLADLNAMGSAQQASLRQLASLLAGEDVQVTAPPDRKPVRSAPIPQPGPQPDSMPLRSIAPISAAFERQQSLTPLPANSAPVFTAPAPMPEPRPSNPSGRRLTLEPDTLVEPNWVIPLEAHADENKKNFAWGKLLGGALLVALLVGCGLFLVRYKGRLGDSISAGLSSAINAWNAPQAAPAPPVHAAAAGTLSSPAAQTESPGENPARTPVAQPSQQPPPAPPTMTQQSSRPVSPPTTDAPSHVSGDAISPRGGAQVVVPEILMSPNLISSRAPTRTVRAQGRVVMQATVNRHGEVTHVHVIDGDPALHQAAVDAALSRRYKPYLLNGTPVDVATTISIDFPGNR